MPDIDFQRIELNLIPKKGDDPVVFYASQYETARPFIADIMWGDTEFAPGDDCWAEIDIRKNDDNLVVITDDVSIDNNEVSVILPVQAVTCIGKNLGQVKIYAADDHLVSALNFILEVQADPLAGGVTSETAIDNLTQQIEDIATEVIGEDYYDKTEVDALLADKADVSDLPDMSLYYTKTATDTLLNAKADKSDTYTKAQVDTALSAKANTADLAAVATSGDYDDLINKPTIPAAQIQSDYTQADTTAVDYIKNKPDIDAMIAAALLAVMPVETATGNPCTFDTDIAVPLKSLIANIVATGGNGTPSTPIPIVGHSELNLVRCGKNLFDITKHNENPSAIFTLNTDGSLSVENPNNWIISINWEYTGLIPNGTYTIKNLSDSVFYVQFAADDYSHYVNADSSYTFSYDGSGYLNILPGNISANTTKVFKIQMEIGSAYTAYEPYNGTPYLVQFGQTVYGGVYDANRGKLLITRGYIDLSTLDPATLGSTPVFYKQLSNVKVPASDSSIAEVISECYTSIRFNGVAGTVNTIAINTSGYIYVNTGSALTIPSGIAVFTLATPIEIDVSELSVDTIIGTNNITSDCNGDVTASYKVSIQKYVDDQ